MTMCLALFLRSVALLLVLLPSTVLAEDAWTWTSSALSGEFGSRSEAEARTRSLGGIYALIDVIESSTIDQEFERFEYGATPKDPDVTDFYHYIIQWGTPDLFFSTEAAAMADVEAYNAGNWAPCSGPIHLEPTNDWSGSQFWYNGMSIHEFREYALHYQASYTGAVIDCAPYIYNPLQGFKQRDISCPQNLNWDWAENRCTLHAIVVISGKPLTSAACIGNPCDAATGDKFQTEVDAVLPWTTIRRYYHSFARSPHEVLGTGWRHSYSSALLMYAGTPAGRMAPDGHRSPIANVGTDTFEESTGSNVRVTKVGAEWVANLVDGSREYYSSTGQLLRQQGRDGQITSLTYDLQGDVATVLHSSGRSLAFRYGGSPKRLLGIDSDGVALVDYVVSGGNFISATYPGGGSRTYHYENGAFPTHLTGITHENSVRYATFGYDGRGRGTLTEHAGGVDRNALVFNADGTTTVTTPLNHAKVYGFTGGTSYRMQSTLQAQGMLQEWIRPAEYIDFRRRPTSSTDARGMQTTYAYPEVGSVRTERRTEAVGLPEQRIVEVDRDLSVGRVVAERRPGREVRMAYNARGQQVARCEIDPSDSAAMGYACSATTSPPLGAKVRRTVSRYCELADITAGTCPLLGLLISTNGARPASDVGMVSGQDDTVGYSYRAAEDPTCATSGACTYRKGDLWKVTNALGQVTETVSYDKSGRVTRMKDANATITDFVYHSRGWLVDRIVRASADGSASGGDAVMHIDYDAVGNVTKVTQPDASFLSYAYDAAHRLIKVTDTLGNAIDYCPGGIGSAECLDAAGNRRVEKIKDPGGTVRRSLTRTYNQLSQLTAVLNAQGAATLTYPAADGYDANGNATHSLDGLTIETKQEYDPLNRLKKTIQDYFGPDVATRDATTEYTYDARDNLLTVNDPDLLTTTYGYDGLNNLMSLQSPDTGTTGYTYDLAGNRKTQTDARGVLSTHTYDALNRLSGITYPTSSLNVTFTYDQASGVTGCAKSFPLGRLTRITDASGTTTYCYDRRGNVTRKTQVTGVTSQLLTYTWTLSDRLATITYPSTGIATYTRNANGQATGVSWKATSGSTAVSVVSGATYYPFGPLNVLTWGNGRTLTKAYDSNYAIDSIASSDPNGLKLDLTTNVMGNITEGRDTIGAVTPTRKYAYDRLYRLKQVDTGSNVLQEGFGYTKTGDRTQKTLPGPVTQAYTYVPSTHKLASVAGVARTSDPNGNQTSLPNVPDPLVYDDRNRLASVTQAGPGSSVISSYTHNGRGERVRKVTSSATQATTQLAVYDEGGHVLREQTSNICIGGEPESRPGGSSNATGCNGSRLVELIYLDGQPVAQVTDGVISYLETDHLGTPRVAANPTSNAWQWTWSFFGGAFGETAPTTASSGGIEVSLRYPGQQYDAEAQLHYNYFRDYEPTTGRYVESDPIGLSGGLSTYGYVSQNTLQDVDPYGLVGIFSRCGVDQMKICTWEWGVASCRCAPSQNRDARCSFGSTNCLILDGPTQPASAPPLCEYDRLGENLCYQVCRSRLNQKGDDPAPIGQIAKIFGKKAGSVGWAVDAARSGWEIYKEHSTCLQECQIDTSKKCCR